MHRQIRPDVREGRNVVVSMLCALVLFMPPLATAANDVRKLPDFTQIVEQVSPAVVNISTTQKISPSRTPGMGPHGRRHDLPENAPFDEFFRRFFGEEGENGPEVPEFDGKSLGSGFIISADGYVLTNYHVVKGADEIVVRLSDKREYDAKIIGSDARSDVALLKIEAKDLPVVKTGKAADLKAGEWVVAIGSPFDFDHTVTAGIVSAVGRSLPNENYVPFIQTDVAINPGNSGGPLFNLEGEVVGVNSQIYSRTGGFMGLSFAIPIDLAMKVVDQLKQGGKVNRGWLGILIQNVTRELAESFGMDRPGGALVARVLPDGPAEKAGFQVGDIVLEFNGQTVADSASLPPIVGNTAIGQKVPVKIMRDGKQKTLSVTIGALPEEEAGEDESAAAPDQGYTDQRTELTVAELTDEQKEQLEGDVTGVLVVDVKRGPAMRAGVRRGDLLQRLNNVEIKTVADFKRAVEGLRPGKSVPVLVQRRGSPIFFALKLAEGGEK